MANKDVFDEKMESLADAINAKAGTSGALTLDGMKSAVDAIELGSDVIANPTLEGGEDDLTSIEIDGTKYSIPEGTSVEANPTLAGTEADLVGIEVNGTKFKVPKGSYIATLSSSNQISADSLAYITAHYMDTPCYVPYNVRDINTMCLFHVAGKSGTSSFITDIITNSGSDTTVHVMWLTILGSSITYHNSIAPNVTANPTGTGSADLTKLTVGSTTYNIPQGTEVAANPTLAGTEAELTGLEVGGTKYKVPSDYLPLAGGTMSGNINFPGDKGIASSEGRIILRSDSDTGAISLGSDYRSSAVVKLITGPTGHVYRMKGSTQYEILDTSNTSANSVPVSTAATLNALKMNGVSYKVRDGITNGLGYLTTAPTADNMDGIKIVVLSAEPATKYAGYLYIITA